MSSHDVLCHAFTFLDYSHVPTLCRVCKEWNMLASSNQLWEFYFRLLSNKLTCKIDVPTETITRLFWKNKMRDNFANYYCRNSKRVSPKTKLADKLRGLFPYRFTSQVVKMILSRIYLDSYWYTTQLDQPMKLKGENDDIDNDFIDNEVYFKMDMQISGIAESIIMRCYMSHNDLGLFGYQYNEGFFLYFAKESDDKLNMEQVRHNSDFEKLGMCNRAFVYKFKGKRKPGTVSGKEYLVNEILDFLVPTVKSFNMSPVEFIPIWCLLFDLIICDTEWCFIHMEFTKCYPKLISNPLAFNLLKKKYSTKVKHRMENIQNALSKFTPANKTEDMLFSAVTNNLVDTFVLDSNNEEKALMGVQTWLKFTEPISRRSPVRPILSDASKKNVEFSIYANYLAYLYRLGRNTDEFIDWYFKEKFKH